jgi:hypothetical protein
VLVPLVGTEKVYAGLGVFAGWTQLLGLVDIVHSATGSSSSFPPVELRFLCDNCTKTSWRIALTCYEI